MTFIRSRQKLEGWTLLLAVSKKQVHRTSSRCDMYQPKWDRSHLHRVYKFRVDKRVREGIADGFIQPFESGQYGDYELTQAGWDELASCQQEHAESV